MGLYGRWTEFSGADCFEIQHSFRSDRNHLSVWAAADTGKVFCSGKAEMSESILQHPEMSFPWNNQITNAIYGFYLDLVVLLTALGFRKEKFAGMEKMVLLLEMGAIFFLAEAFLSSPPNWYLPIALLLNCIALFQNMHLQKKKKAKEQRGNISNC